MFDTTIRSRASDPSFVQCILKHCLCCFTGFVTKIEVQAHSKCFPSAFIPANDKCHNEQLTKYTNSGLLMLIHPWIMAKEYRIDQLARFPIFLALLNGLNHAAIFLNKVLSKSPNGVGTVSWHF